MPDRVRSARRADALAAVADLDDTGNAHLARAAVARCQLCDGDGYRNGVVCDHVNRANVGRPQRDHIRKILAKGESS